MAEKKVKITIGVKDEASAKLRKISKQFERSAEVMRTAGLVMIGAGVAIGFISKTFVTAASQIEDYRVRLETLLGSQQKATEAMAFFDKIASKVPFSIEKVTEAGVTLEAMGASFQKWLPVLSDVAAVMGVDMVTAASALGRAYAGGAGAADIFRERGILNIIKSSKGITDLSKLTLPEFRDAMFDAFVNPAGRISGAAEKLSKTWTGQLSMLGDSVFKISKEIGDTLLPTLKKLIAMTKSVADIFSTLPPWVKKLTGTFFLLAPPILVAAGALLFFGAQLMLIQARGGITVLLSMIATGMKSIAASTYAAVKPLAIILLVYTALVKIVALLITGNELLIASWHKLRGDTDKAVLHLRFAWRAMDEGGKVMENLGESFNKLFKSFFGAVDVAAAAGATDGTAYADAAAKAIGVSTAKSLGKKAFGLGDFIPAMMSLTTGGGIVSGGLIENKANIITINVSAESKVGKEIISFLNAKGALA